MRYTFAVLGDGAFGTAIAILLAQDPRHRVRLWSAREENGRILRERRENVRLLPGVPIPEGVAQTAVLSGPSHAEEVSRGLPTSVVVASQDVELARWVQQRFTTERFRVYTNLDPVGVELGGALKNIIGVAAGISDGLGLGDNAKAALMTRGLAEMTRFGVALGALPETFHGLAGLGDLITTCVSPHGRNRRLG